MRRAQNIDSAIITTNTAIGELDLSVRTYNRLKCAGIATVGEILRLTGADLDRLRSEGNTLIGCMEEVKAVLKEHGFGISI